MKVQQLEEAERRLRVAQVNIEQLGANNRILENENQMYKRYDERRYEQSIELTVIFAFGILYRVVICIRQSVIVVHFFEYHLVQKLTLPESCNDDCTPTVVVEMRLDNRRP